MIRPLLTGICLGRWRRRRASSTGHPSTYKDSSAWRSIWGIFPESASCFAETNDLLTTRHRLLNSGCPNNVPAGHGVNLDHVVEHYRKQHLDEEERKAKKLAEAKKE